jgi:DNA-damage-inducible protein D
LTCSGLIWNNDSRNIFVAGVIMEPKETIVLFKNHQIRRVIFQNEWWFSVIDVVQILTEQTNNLSARKYWNKLAERLRNEGSEVVTNCHRLKLLAPDGKMRETDCSNTEGLLRIIQTIPSPNAEPFKRWLARVGYERIKEIEDPELATKRTRALYQAKGYSDDWIEKRMRGIAIREQLTDEWKHREVGGDREYAILTAEISKATFGMTPSKYKRFKHLKKQNLRDHMDDLELIFTMLGEASTTRITQARDVKGYPENLHAAQEGGQVAGEARKSLERRSGQKVSTSTNYLQSPQNKRLLKK